MKLHSTATQKAQTQTPYMIIRTQPHSMLPSYVNVCAVLPVMISVRLLTQLIRKHTHTHQARVKVCTNATRVIISTNALARAFLVAGRLLQTDRQQRSRVC